MRFCKDHIEIDDSYAKCMTIAQYPQQLDDKFIATLLQQVPYIVLSIAIQPVETEDAYREIEDSRMKTDAEKVRFNKNPWRILTLRHLYHSGPRSRIASLPVSAKK